MLKVSILITPPGPHITSSGKHLYDGFHSTYGVMGLVDLNEPRYACGHELRTASLNRISGHWWTPLLGKLHAELRQVQLHLHALISSYVWDGCY